MTKPPTPEIAARDQLAERLRALLADAQPLDERSMFGSRAFMVRDKLVACAFKQGRLLVRVEADREPDLLERPGADRAVMAGRDMGAGWVSVDPEAITDDAALKPWLDVALDYNRAQAGGRDDRAKPGDIS